jgi:hypothetical protein
MFDSLRKWLLNVGLAEDEELNCILGGLPTQTLSYRTAYAAGYRPTGRIEQRKEWACLFCVMLDYLVQRGHCADQFNDDPTPFYDYLRAFICISSVFVAIYYAVHWLTERLAQIIGRFVVYIPSHWSPSCFRLDFLAAFCCFFAFACLLLWRSEGPRISRPITRSATV